MEGNGVNLRKSAPIDNAARMLYFIYKAVAIEQGLQRPFFSFCIAILVSPLEGRKTQALPTCVREASLSVLVHA